MALILRGIGPIVAFLLVASVLVGADGLDQTRKKEPAPSAAPQAPKTGAAPAPPERADAPAVQPAADPRIVKNEVSAEAILGGAQKRTEQARQIIVANLANANTPGYKRQIVSFSTLLAGSTLTLEELHKTVARDLARRSGVVVAGTHTDLRPGRIRRTGRQLDLAVEGEGYFEVQSADDENNRSYFTRCGRFELDKHGHIVLRGLKRDWLVIPSFLVPEGATKIEITSEGVVYVTVDDGRVNIGQFSLHSLPADCTFTPCGDSVFFVRFNGKRTSHCIGNPGINGRGELRQGCLEDSNVDPQQELEELQKLQQQSDALEQAARLLHPAAKPPAGLPERSPQ